MINDVQLLSFFLDNGIMRRDAIERVTQMKEQDPIGDIFASIDELYTKMQMVKNACKLADEQLSSYIFEAVTRDRSFTYLQTVLEIPCSRSTFYDRYRKFYYILSNLRK